MSHNEPPRRKYSLFSKPLKSCVEPVLRPVFREQGSAISTLIAHWPSIVGSQLAAHSAPVKLTFPRQKNTDGQLLVACEGAHAPALQHLTPQIVQQITLHLGYAAVSRISLQHTLQAAPQANDYIQKKSVHPIDTHIIASVEDAELKQALEDFARELSSPK